jgi:hypothetical protein
VWLKFDNRRSASISCAARTKEAKASVGKQWSAVYALQYLL